MTEIVFITLKQERVYLKDYARRSEARSIFFSNIARFYNRLCRHSAQGNES